MAFYGEKFTFDGMSSEIYGLKIYTPDSKERRTVIELKSNLVKPHRQSRFLPSKQYVDEPRVLPISLYSEEPLTRSQIDRIEQWLFSKDGKFRKLRVDQEDMANFYYNCRLQRIEEELFGNKIHTLHCIMECDSQYAWENEQTRNYILDDSIPYMVEFVNMSSEEIMSPTYTITCNSDNGTVKIVNSAYELEQFNIMEFDGLQNGEILTIDTYHCMITSNKRTTGLLDLFKAYINFMRLEKGKHILSITGNISEFKITYQNARLIGG